MFLHVYFVQFLVPCNSSPFFSGWLQWGSETAETRLSKRQQQAGRIRHHCLEREAGFGIRPMRVRGLIVFAVILGALRGTTPAQNSTSIFRNTDPAVAYTGSASCVVAGCHEAIGQTYWKTPHGQSMAPANRPQELARVPHAFTVSNPKNHRTYTVYQRGGELFTRAVTELDKHGHRLYSQAHKLDYVSGGERTGYSYLY